MIGLEVYLYIEMIFFFKFYIIQFLRNTVIYFIIDSFPRILKRKIIKLIPVLLDPRGQRPRLTGIDIMTFILLFVENCLKYDTIHEFSVWLRTGFNPADINWFLSHTGK